MSAVVRSIFSSGLRAARTSGGVTSAPISSARSTPRPNISRVAFTV